MNYSLKSLRHGAAVSVALIAMSTTSFAQVLSPSSNSNAGAASNSNSSSGSVSGSRSQVGNTTSNANQNTTQGTSVGTSSGATINQTTSVPDRQRFDNNYSGGTNNYTTDRSTSDVVVRTTPTVYAPPVSGGNPCTLAVSGGVSVIGWGAAAGGTFVDQDCANRQKIAMVWNSGLKDIAFELMCNDRDTYNAAKSTASGPRCAFRQQFEPQGAVAQPQPVPLGPQPVVQRTSSVTPPPAPGRFVCMDRMGKIVKEGTPGASCGQI